ncbi:hypothetical protein SAMN06265222_10797 [Neorhodopirellula lusitana]|uniref:Uncharacterized protein n=2 Tax=Neorhodopirellula lusitana TaxID=445327 RepID=A0ABY1Q743_9BACT|nr:hypothetical protein SAMN06265222_10797 [Neorhodopirellula lusitana]
MALLLMADRGFIYWDHLPSLWTRKMFPTGHTESVRVPPSVTTTTLPSREPDFIFEQPSTGNIGLAEAKGHIVTAGNSPDYKSDLAGALGQVLPWTHCLNPSPTENYAISSYYQEANATDPTLIAFTDPPPRKEADPEWSVSYTPDDIRRGNYGAWLIGMGLQQTGQALRSRDDVDPSERKLAILDVQGEDFAIAINRFLCPCLFTHPFSRLTTDFDGGWETVRNWFQMGVFAVPIFGIAVNVLRSIEEAIAEPKGSALQRSRYVSRRANFSKVKSTELLPGGFAGSIFPDGTLFGFLDRSSPLWQTEKQQSFKLAEDPQRGIR